MLRARALEQAAQYRAIALDAIAAWQGQDDRADDKHRRGTSARTRAELRSRMLTVDAALLAVDPPPSGASPHWMHVDGREQSLRAGTRELASLWHNADNWTWHTWDDHGVGGENGVDRDEATAKREVMAALQRQGWLPTSIAGASPQAETDEDMGDGWYVTVGRWGESLVTIEQRCLSGKADFTDDDAALIRGAAKHLQQFIGQPAPVSPVEPTPPAESSTTEGDRALIAAVTSILEHARCAAPEWCGPPEPERCVVCQIKAVISPKGEER